MIRHDIASFSVYGGHRTVAEITALIGLSPTEWGDAGERTPAGRAGRRYAPEYLTYPSTYWSLTANADSGGSVDYSGFDAVEALVERLLPRADAVAELRRDAQLVMWWSGASDSTQGGFVMTAELLAGSATLGCELRGTAYIDEEPDD